MACRKSIRLARRELRLYFWQAAVEQFGNMRHSQAATRGLEEA